MDVTQRVRDLIVISGRLTELLDKENGALKAGRTDEVSPLLKDKTALGRAYESRFRGLAEETVALKAVDASLRERLRGVAEKVEQRMRQNEALLRVALEAHRRVVQVIAEAVQASQPSAGTYSPAGTVSPADRAARGPVAALTINQSL